MSDTITTIQSRLDKPISFIGLMGAGKTRIGLEVAKILEKPFLDADHEIEKAAGYSVAEIFERFGEASFRDGERRVIARIVEEERACVLATGGGAVMTDDTATVVAQQTVCVWLDTDIDVLVERTSRNDKRPLLKQGDPRAILLDLYEKRQPVYARVSHIRITGGENNARATALDIIEKIAAYCQS